MVAQMTDWQLRHDHFNLFTTRMFRCQNNGMKRATSASEPNRRRAHSSVLSQSESYENDVLLALRRIIRAVDLHSKQLAKQFGLTIPQVVVLRSISALGEVTVGQLSDNVSLSQATVTTILDRLEQRGLATRYRSSTDRRIVHASLTRKGEKALSNAPPLLNHRFSEMFANLNRKDQANMVKTLETIAVMLDDRTLKPIRFMHSDN